jgi:hypothetical protein
LEPETPLEEVQGAPLSEGAERAPGRSVELIERLVAVTCRGLRREVAARQDPGLVLSRRSTNAR